MKAFLNIYLLSEKDLVAVFKLNAKHRSGKQLEVMDYGTGYSVKLLDIFDHDFAEWKTALSHILKFEYREMFMVEMVDEE